MSSPDRKIKVTDERLTGMLSSALGEKVLRYLEDESVIELMLNPDGKLWLDKLGIGRSFSGFTFSPEDAERVIFIVARSMKAVCSKESPIISGELPLAGARFQGMLPPVVQNPTFTIRKKALKIFSLDDYIAQGVIDKYQAFLLRKAVQDRKNVLIVGGTGSGKTTLANAILAVIAKTEDRVVIIEDTQELQCEAKDAVLLRTKEGLASMTDLLKATMRLRPDRIVIGEVRGPEALALLKAWNTGHPGGCATVHANSGREALPRLEQLIMEGGVMPSKELVGKAVNVVVFIKKTAKGRKVTELLQVDVEEGKYIFTDHPHAEANVDCAEESPESLLSEALREENSYAV
jgi:P-type conjugative transfer ATPase TrbB